MMENYNTTVKDWLKFTLNVANANMKFSIIRLPNDRFEEYLDFKMNYYVKHEITHRIAGIPESKEAMDEYRQILRKTLKHPSNQLMICCPEDTNVQPEIVAVSGLKLIKRGCSCDHYDEAKTEPVKRFFIILREWNNLFPIPDLMNNYNIDYYFDDIGAAVHPNFRGLGIGNKISIARRLICTEYGVPMTGAWMTAAGSQKAAGRDGWETVYDISYEDLGRQLGITFEDVPITCKYMIARIKNKKMYCLL